MSQNPYKVLGIAPDASDEDVKRAYRELARKYHPDRYKDNDLAELAGEKMKEINAAYEEIQQMRTRGKGTGDGLGAESSGAGAYSQDARSKFIHIRNCINQGNISEAERLIYEVDPMDRAAEWHFLLGCIRMRKGEYVDAQREFDTAYRMEPTNNEYFRFKEAMRRRSDQFGGGYKTTSGDGCSLCTTLLCADCCCECMGGDLIPCC